MRLPFKTEPICLSACSFSSAVFETIQSDGAKILRSRIYASLAVNRTQMLPAIPVKMTRRMRSQWWLRASASGKATSGSTRRRSINEGEGGLVPTASIAAGAIIGLEPSQIERPGSPSMTCWRSKGRSPGFQSDAVWTTR